MHFKYGILPLWSVPHSSIQFLTFSLTKQQSLKQTPPTNLALLKQPPHVGPFSPTADPILTMLIFKHALQWCFCIWPHLVNPACPLWATALVLVQSECFHCGPPERSTAPPIYGCARNRRWQVKWLTCPLGLLTQGCRTPRHGRWYRTLHVAVEVRWGKRFGWNGKSSHVVS